MILVDTSIWIEHLARGEARLSAALDACVVATHPFVVGELACGNLRNRGEVLYLLRRLPQLPVATDDETLQFVESRSLSGRGIGWLDAHLLASTVLAEGARLWTRDRRLAVLAAELGVVHV